MLFKKKTKKTAEQTVPAAEPTDERKLPLILRWPISIVLLFVMPPFGTAIGIGLSVARLIFNHKYPRYKLKLRTKLIVSTLCVAFVVWAVVTAPESSTTTSAEAAPAEQSEPQTAENTTAPEETEPAQPQSADSEKDAQAEPAAEEQKKQEAETKEKQTEAEPAAQAETEKQKEAEKQKKEEKKQQKREEKAAKKLARQQKRANRKIEKALSKEKTEKAAKKLSHVKENWVYAYYQQMLPDLIEQDDRTQLDRYLTIYRQAFPETEQMKDVLTAWDQICDDQKKMDELDKKYRSDYSGGMSGAISAVDKAEERTFYLQYKLKNSAANSKNSVISAVGEAIGAAQESLTGTYEYLANNVTNDFIPSLLQGYIDMNVYPGDEQYVLITTKPFSQAGATTVYAYQSGTRTLTTSDGFEKEVECYRVMDSTTRDTIRQDYETYSVAGMSITEASQHMQELLNK